MLWEIRDSDQLRIKIRIVLHKLANGIFPNLKRKQLITVTMILIKYALVQEVARGGFEYRFSMNPSISVDL